MESFDSILHRTRSLSPADRLRLARALFAEAESTGPADDPDIGIRGLAAWTESTRNEDWSAFYPAALRQRKVG